MQLESGYNLLEGWQNIMAFVSILPRSFEQCVIYSKIRLHFMETS